MKNVAIVAFLFPLFFGCSAPQEERSDVLAAGYALPTGFTSLYATGSRGGEGQRIEGTFHSAGSDATVRYTTVRGSMSDRSPGEPVLPIDVCIRDASTSATLLPSSMFGDRPLIEGCGNADGDDDHTDGGSHEEHGSVEFERKRAAAIEGLESLQTVKFKAEYEPERERLVAQLIAARFDPERDMPPGRIVKEDASGRVVYYDEPH